MGLERRDTVNGSNGIRMSRLHQVSYSVELIIPNDTGINPSVSDVASTIAIQIRIYE